MKYILEVTKTAFVTRCNVTMPEIEQVKPPWSTSSIHAADRQGIARTLTLAVSDRTFIKLRNSNALHFRWQKKESLA